jgi:multiple sugar transport system ATP-binding protein
MSTLNINQISKKFGSVEVLKKINLSVDQGKFLVLLGPSGCGKSTLLNIIAGLETLDEGELLIDDYNVNNVEPKDRNIAMVFQSYALYPSMTVRGNMEFGLKQTKADKKFIDSQIKKVADFLKVDELLERKPSQLSGGQRQRVAMGRALVREPGIFLFDEPLSNLDAKLRVEMRHEIKKLHNKLNTTIVYVTHDQIEAMSLATEIAVMNNGVIEQLDPPQKIYDEPNSLFVADFVGSPSMNLIEGAIESNNDGLSFYLKNNNSFRLPISNYNFNNNSYDKDKVILGIRPEYISSREGILNSNYETNLETILVETTGYDQNVKLELYGQEIISRFPPNIKVKTGEKIQISFDLSKISLFNSIDGKRI